MSFAPGYAILIDDKYLLIDKIAQSKYAEVFLVCDPATSELFARKINLFDDAQSIQEAQQEVELTPVHSHTTCIISTHFYPTSRPTKVNGVDQAGYQSIVTKFCNGKTLDLLQDNLIRIRDVLLPEPLIWRFLGQAFDTIFDLATTSPFVTQGDGSAKNWFLHWIAEDIPDLILGDFGDASSHLSLSNIFATHLNNDKLFMGRWTPAATQSELQDLEEWWERVCYDLRCALQQITVLVTRNADEARWMVWSDLYPNACRYRSRGLQLYSEDLVDALADLYSIITTEYSPGPNQYMFGYGEWVECQVFNLRMLKAFLATQRTKVCSIQPPLFDNYDLYWMQDRHSRDMPLIWKREDLSALVKASDSQKHGNARMLEFADSPAYGPLTLPIKLRANQYEIVKVTEKVGHTYDVGKLMKLRNRQVL